MYCYIVKTSAIGLNVLAALVTITAHPVNAQSISNFVDLNQSRQFFNEGNEIIEREIKWLQYDLEFPQIKIPEHSYRSQNISKSDFLSTRVKLQPMYKEAARDNMDNWELGCSFSQLTECDR